MDIKSFGPGQVLQVKDRKLISDFLSLDRVWASEALLSLSDDFWNVSEWYGYQDGSNLGLCLIFKKLSPTPVFLTGEPNCIAHIIRQEIKADKIFVECPLGCVGVLKEFYNFNSALIMNKMQLEHFRHSSFTIHPAIRRLTPDDFQMARDLYYRNTEYGNFDPDQFNNGIYFGVQDGPNLVSMSGTTVLCMDYRTATIGNVITDNNYRNRGYATSELILLCRAILEESYDCICMKANRGNNASISLYRRIGFVKKCEYFEGVGIRK